LTGAEFEEREPEAVAALIALAQPAGLVQVADRAFHDPAFAAEAGAVLGAAACDHWHDPAGPQLPSVGVVVIAAIGENPVGLATRTTDLASNRRLTPQVDQRQKLGDIVAVTCAERNCQRNTLRIRQGVGLDAILRAIDRGRASEAPPKTARCEDPSTTPVLQSIPSWAFSSASSRS
jgi:hypothetical protein